MLYLGADGRNRQRPRRKNNPKGLFLFTFANYFVSNCKKMNHSFSILFKHKLKTIQFFQIVWFKFGADGRNRTGMGGLVPQDFKSCASTSFATSACLYFADKSYYTTIKIFVNSFLKISVSVTGDVVK